MRQWLWLYRRSNCPLVWGIALLFGSHAVLDLRLLGLWQRVPVKRSRRSAARGRAELLLIVPSGHDEAHLTRTPARR